MFNRNRLKKYLTLAIFLCSFSMQAQAVDVQGMIIKPSEFTVSETLDRLEKILVSKEISVFARIDHAAGAEKIGKELSATQLLIFGNPKLGTPLLQQQQTIGIDLPLKVVAWEDDQGNVWLGYNTPEYVAQRHHIEDAEEIINKMAGALKKFTDYAVAAE